MARRQKPRRIDGAGLHYPWLVLGLALLVSLVAISGRTLWIDEALTAVKAMKPNLGAWWGEMVREKASDLQMPLYMVYMWGYEKVFGGGEWSLRMANLPWFVTGTAVFAWSIRNDTTWSRFALALVLLSPFGWYYLDEARPYAMQLGASLVIVGGLYRISSETGLAPQDGGNGSAAFFWFLAGLLCLSGSSLLGMIWAGAAIAAFVWVNPGGWLRLIRHHRLASLVTIVGLTGWGIYYLWTLAVGARASAGATTSFQSVLFVGYELLGFMGLGPGRLELRGGGIGTLKPYLAFLTLYGALVCVVLLLGGRQWFRRDTLSARRKWLLTGIVACPALFLLTTGVVASFRVLGRHFTPALPVIALVLGIGASALWVRRGFVGKALITLFLGLNLVSCLELRFAERQGKDDYRRAAYIAKEALARGAVVWWNAAEQGARYGAESPVCRRCLALLEPRCGDSSCKWSTRFDHNFEVRCL